MRMEQTIVTLEAKPRGIHLVTGEIVARLPQIALFQKGMLHLFLQHTSAALSLNENADPDVRADAERFLDRLIPDGWAGFAHTLEGPDDMPAHLKSILVGAQLTVPIRSGRLALGTWQGLYLLEGRNEAQGRSVVATLWGEEELTA